MKIEIKTRDIGHGSCSIYLETTENGKRTYEALGLYLIPAKAPDARRLNEAAMAKAVAIKSKRLLGICEPEDCITDEILLVDWMDIYIRNLAKHLRKSSLTHHKTLVKAMTGYLKKKRKSNIKVKDFDKSMYLGFLSYIKNDYRVIRGTKAYPLSEMSLFNKQRNLNQMLNAAVKDSLIMENPFFLLSNKEKYKKPDTEREALTIEELKKLEAAPSHSRDSKEAFMFCCFTGLRLGDVMKLRWRDIHKVESGEIIKLAKQKKTSKPVIIPLNQNALRWLPQRKGKTRDDLIYDLPERTSCREAIVRLAKRAGIKRKVCWHTSRHTFATLNLTAGSDLYTVSKLLGHSSVATTSIYADVVMDKRIDAVNLTKGIFS